LSYNISNSKRNIGTNTLRTTDSLEWIGTISVGTPEIQFEMNFDTGSSGFWVPDITCETCGDHARYDPGASSTSIWLRRGFTLPYDDGYEVSGQLFTETVTIAGLTITHQTMGTAIDAEWSFEQVEDGILGLAFRSVTVFNAASVFQTLINQNQLDFPVFAMKLQDLGMNSELTIGELNPDLYKGPVTYAGVTQGAPLWEIPFDSLNIDGQQVFGSTLCVVDSVCSNYSLLTT
jgi:cathepsin D